MTHFEEILQKSLYFKDIFFVRENYTIFFTFDKGLPLVFVIKQNKLR